MGRMDFVPLAVLGGAIAIACGTTVVAVESQPSGSGGVDATDRDDSGVVEATGDAAIDRAPPPTCANGALCDGVCVPDCAACATGKLLCRVTGTCVAECAACTAGPVECWSCGGNGPAGSCEANQGSGFCLGGDGTYPAGRKHCACDAEDLDKCPGASHTCVVKDGAPVCVTCGEAGYETRGKDCKSGRVCDPTQSPPRCGK